MPIFTAIYSLNLLSDNSIFMNKTANYQFTIVIPVYNEEDNIYSLEKN